MAWSDTRRIRAPSIYVQAVVASLLYNLMHLLAWEVSMAAKLGWEASLVAGIGVAVVSAMSGALVAVRRILGLILAMIPVLWAVLLHWVLVYVMAGHREPNGVWWYPVFPVLQGLLIVYFSALVIQADRQPTTPEDRNVSLTSPSDVGRGLTLRGGLASPAIYLHIVAAFLLVQIGQKVVRELVVAASHGPVGVILMSTLTLITVSAALLILRRRRSGLWLGVFCGVVLLAQPIGYHVILQRPCLGGIWWYPVFTAFQGAFILYFSALLWRNEATLSKRRASHPPALDRLPAENPT